MTMRISSRTRKLLLLTSGFLILHVAAAFINQPGAEPKFSFLQEPVEQAIVSKRFPAVLHCTVKLSESIRDDFRYSFEGHRSAIGGDDVEENELIDEDEEEDDGYEDVGLGGSRDSREDYEDPEKERGEGKSTATAAATTTAATTTLNQRKQSTHFNALKADDDPVPALMGDHALRFDHRGDGLELFQDFSKHLASRQLKAQESGANKTTKKKWKRKQPTIRRRHSSSRRKRNVPPFQYTWTKNGEPLDLEGRDVYELGKDGTLRISYFEEAGGIYRCVINGTQWNFGALISRESNVIVADFTRSNVATNVTAEIGDPLVLNCPIYSAPAANVTWFFNDTPIDYGAANNRYYQMVNGSLLIAKVTGFDDGKFKCVAVNNYVPKSTRVFKQQVNVVPQQNLSEVQRRAGRLMGPFQDVRLRLKERSSLYLLCAAYHSPGNSDSKSEVRWTFTPRSSVIPIALEGFGNELRFGQVSRDKHEGVYNCSSKREFQTFDVSILVPPMISRELNSTTTTMAATVKLECAATGYPKPEIIWFRNGDRISSSSVTVVDGGTLKIHSVDPDEEGIYQCFARNEVGQAFTTSYLTVRTNEAHAKLPKLYGIKCYPINYGSVLVTFRATEPVDMITYYLKGDSPHSWEAVPPIQTIQKFIVSGRMDPLREYTLLLRGLTQASMEPQMRRTQESMLIMSRRSKSVTCKTQGMEVLSTAFPDHIFIWWTKGTGGTNRRTNYSVEVDHYLVQLWNNETLNNPSLFADEVIGTSETLDEYKTWNQIEKLLVKIPAQTSFINSTYAVGTTESFIASSVETKRKSMSPQTGMHWNVTEIRVPGNVTGLLIPNTKRVLARVIGVKAGEVILDQQLKYVQWKSVENSVNGVSKLRIVNTNSKNVQLAWNAFGKEKSTCLMLCYKNTNTDFLMRDSLTDCKTINANKSSVMLKPLPPNTSYKMYLRTCTSAEPITDIIDVLTRPDVPGKVSDPRLRMDGEAADDDVILSWGPPLKQPGVFIQYYAVEWVKWDGSAGAQNLTENEFALKLPGITGEDIFNISIQAVGNTGIGIPHFYNLTKPMKDYIDTNQLLNAPSLHKSKYTDTILAVAIGSVLCVVFIFICGTIIYCHRRRAKARRRQHQMEQQAHEQQQLRGNQQMMHSVDYAGLNNGTDSYHFDMPNGVAGEIGIGGVHAPHLTTILPSSDPLTFLQPSIVRDEILSGTVPTIIRRQPILTSSGSSEDQVGAHEMQTLISSSSGPNLDHELMNGGGTVHVVPNMTMTSAMSEETMSVLSDSSSERVSSLGTSRGGGVGRPGNSEEGLNLNSDNEGIPLTTSTPTKVNGVVWRSDMNGGGGGIEDLEQQMPLVANGGNGGVEWLGHKVTPQQQLPIVELYRPISFTNNNNPMLVNKNVTVKENGIGNIPKVQQHKIGGNAEDGTVRRPLLGGGGGVVYSTVNKRALNGSNGGFVGGSTKKKNRGKDDTRSAGPVELERDDGENLIRRDGRLIHEHGYVDDEDSRTGLLLNGSVMSNGSVEGSKGTATVMASVPAPNGVTKSTGANNKGVVVANPLWDTFRRPLVGPNG